MNSKNLLKALTNYGKRVYNINRILSVHNLKNKIKKEKGNYGKT